MDAVESKKEKRRAYKAAWMRRKRAEQRSGEVRYVQVKLPAEIAVELERRRGGTMSEKIVRIVAEGLYRNEPTMAEGMMGESSEGGHVASRNSPCPCGSGRKFKRCHGAAKVR